MSSLSLKFPRWCKQESEYSRLNQHTTTTSPEPSKPRWHDIEDSKPARLLSPVAMTAFAAMISFIFGIALTLTFMVARQSPTAPGEIIWGPSDMPLGVKWQKFEGRLYELSPYRGPPTERPSKEIDAAWARYGDGKPWFNGGAVLLPVTEDDIRQARKTEEFGEWFNSTVVLDQANGGGYMATLEMFHQLHCLDKVRRATYPEDIYDRPEHSWRSHVDHCIDMIRQVLMCHGDTGLVNFHWVSDLQAATPDFSTWHQCRDPEAILEWAHQHEAPMVKQVIKPKEGIIEMPTLN